MPHAPQLRRVLAVVSAVVLLLGLAAAGVAPASAHRGGPRPRPHPPGTPPARACIDPDSSAVPISLTVDGGTATGFYALPPRRPVGLVVFSHGWGHSSFSWTHHLTRVARDLNVITVAMDGRGLRFLDTRKPGGQPDTRGWPVSAAAEDGIAAARELQGRCPSATTVVNYGVSMGGNTSGLMAAARAQRRDGRPLFDYWIVVEGVTNVTSTYAGARAIASGNNTARTAVEDIEAEMGGPIETRPEAYRERSVVTRAGDIRDSKVKGVVLVHGVDDGLVDHGQSQSMRGALVAAGVPTQFFTVTSKTDRTPADDSATGYVGTAVDPAYRSPLAGHGNEISTVHIVIATGFERLTALFGGQLPTCTREHVVDGRAGTAPPPGPC
ncbi:MAG: prolyl oligopeptidase family serine peptidase [Actinobacteria bacterium]|nr:prolyl oligopeptidase family serine peptidase [Actinomycetota bacterium]